MIDVYSSSSKQNLASRKQKTSNEEKVRDRQTRQTRLKGGPQECSDKTRIHTRYGLCSSAALVDRSTHVRKKKRRITTRHTSHRPGLEKIDTATDSFPFALRRLRVLGFFFDSVFCIMSSSNNGHKVSYKRCQNIAFIIADESTHPSNRRYRPFGLSIRAGRARFQAKAKRLRDLHFEKRNKKSSKREVSRRVIAFVGAPPR